MLYVDVLFINMKVCMQKNVLRILWMKGITKFTVQSCLDETPNKRYESMSMYITHIGSNIAVYVIN